MGDCFITGMALFALGFFCRKRNKNFFARAIKVWGEVVSYQSRLVENIERDRPRYVRMYYPTVRFYFDGETREVTAEFGSDIPPVIGHRKQVGINPENIEEARVYSGASELLDWFFMLLGGFLMFAGGAVFLIGLVVVFL